MSYTRIKTINGQRYRYEITSYRDPVTGKVRHRSQYVGKVRDLGTTAKLGQRVRVKATGKLGRLSNLFENSEFVYACLDGSEYRSLYRREELEAI